MAGPVLLMRATVSGLGERMVSWLEDPRSPGVGKEDGREELGRRNGAGPPAVSMD